MSNKIIYILVTILLLMICLVACKENIEIYDNNSSISSTISVPIVIVDDEDASEQPTQSEIDEIDKTWENNTPNVSIEVGSSNEEKNETDKNSSSGNSSDNTTSDNNDANDSSSNVTSDTTSSTDSSEETGSTDSSNTDSSDTESGKEDDGYFDVAV